MHRERLVLDAQFLARDAAHALGRNLGLRHPHHVLIRHAHGELARDFLEQPARRAGGGVGIDQSAQPVEIELGIAEALIGNQPPYALNRGRLRQRGQ